MCAVSEDALRQKTIAVVDSLSISVATPYHPHVSHWLADIASLKWLVPVSVCVLCSAGSSCCLYGGPQWTRRMTGHDATGHDEVRQSNDLQVLLLRGRCCQPVCLLRMLSLLFSVCPRS